MNCLTSILYTMIIPSPLSMRRTDVLSHTKWLFIWFYYTRSPNNWQSVHTTPPKDKACSQKRGNIANVRSSRQGAKKLQFLSGCNFKMTSLNQDMAQKFHKFRVLIKTLNF